MLPVHALVPPALVPAAALLGDREVESEAAAVELDRVLLRGGEAVAVGDAAQTLRVRHGVRAAERRVRVARPRVEVVVLDAAEALGGAAAHMLLDVPRRPQALAARRDVDRELARPVLVLEVPEHQRARPPVARLVLEGVDVADRVVAGGPRAPVARDDGDTRGQRIGAADLV